jgi:plasmid stabilization system protein ParE
MSEEVVLTATALKDFNNVTGYRSYYWGEKVKNNFIDRFDEVIDFLSKSPGIYAFFDKTKRIQRCVVTKHNVLYFIEKDALIEIITVFDTRQDPKKLTSII